MAKPFYIHTLTKVLGLDPDSVIKIDVNVGTVPPTATVVLTLTDQQLAALFRNDSAES
jgi:hypothetical protein